MKNSIIIMLLALSLAVTLASCSNPAPKNPAVESITKEQIVYTCTMHPEIQNDKPGDCPKCGMALVKMEPGTNASMPDDTGKMHKH
jgi:hypothetical protein